MDVVGEQGFDKAPHFFELRQGGVSLVVLLDGCTDVQGGVGSQEVPVALERVQGPRAPNVLLDGVPLAELDVWNRGLREHETIVLVLRRAVLHQLLQVHYQLSLLVVPPLEGFELPHP